MISSQFIQSCQSGDENAIRNLVQTYQRGVFQLALSIIDDGWVDPAAADITQDSPVETFAADEAEAATRETFVAAVDRIGRYREGSSFEHWLYAIAIQVSRRRARRWRMRRSTVGGLRRMWSAVAGKLPAQPTGMTEEHLLEINNPRPADPSLEIQPGDRSHLHAGDAELWDAVRRLDEKLRIPIVLRYYHDYPISEIAHLLHISEGVVHARLDAAREKIALRLGK